MNDLQLVKVHNDVFLSVHKEKETTWKPLILSVVIFMLILVSTAALVKINRKNEELPEQLKSSYPCPEDINLSKTEKELLILLLNAVGYIGQSENEPDTYTIYINTLYDYFTKPDVSISISQSEKMKKEISDLYLILQNEDTNKLDFMSIDGRAVALYLFQQIYEECNMQIVFDERGTISSIYNEQNQLFYEKQAAVTHEGIHVSSAIIIISVLVVLIGICYRISIKKQLFKEDVIYDGFEEKRFA